MELVVGKFAWLVVCYVGGILVGVLLHELGHGLVALLATRQEVELEIGRAGKRGAVGLGRLAVVFRSRGLRYGGTRYDRSAVSRGRQTLVAMGGPLASLLACVGFGWAMVTSVVGAWDWIAYLALAVANFRILLVSAWPMAHRPDGPGGVEWESDGLDIWRMWRR